MYKYTWSLAFPAVVIAAFGVAANVQAELILFGDNFDATSTPTSGNTYCLNADLGTRLTGTVAGDMINGGTAWGRDHSSVGNSSVQVNNSSYPGVLMCQRSGSTSNFGSAIIQNNFNTPDIAAAGGFDLIFDVLPQASSATNGAVVAVGVSTNNANEWGTVTNALTTTAGTASADFVLYIRSNGYMGIRHAGADIGLNTGTNANGYAGTGWNTFDLHVATTSFAGGSGTATATLYYGAGKDATTFNQVVLTASGANNTGLSGDFKSFTWTWDDGNNYLAMSQYVGASAVTQYDNVRVSILPEPSIFALLPAGLIGLAACAWRKRN
jgi:hypothetical protein